MTSQPDIRPMRPDETDATIALWTKCGLTRPWNDPNHDIAFASQTGNAEILVAVMDEKIIASVMTGHDGHRGVAYYVAVHPDAQGHGLGTKMMAAAEAWCLERGAWKMNIMVRDDNAAALGFYDRLGYTHGNTTQLGKWLDPARAPKET